jgi:predicted AlkP superfamily phosphohydrolase/phosphomutase
VFGLTSPPGKQTRALGNGPKYNKRFEARVDALDEALAALQERASVLHHATVVKTSETVKSVEEMVIDAASIGVEVDARTTTTLHHVEGLQSETRDIRFATERIDAQIPAIADGVKASNVKLGAVHDKVETLTDIQLAAKHAARALEISLDTAECECRR